MPLIIFECGQIGKETKIELIRTLTELSARITRIPKELFLVSIHELPDEDIAVGGTTVSGAPAKVIKADGGPGEAPSLDRTLGHLSYEAFDYNI